MGLVRVGHWTSSQQTTGCTAVVFPEGCVASGEVRGGAPATREFALLEPTAMVEHVDAVVLTGGSAFGLAATDGVVKGLAESGRGFETRAGRVPIVVGMALFDLAEGDVRPGPAAGRHAFDEARADFGGGRVGAGAGATIGKWRPGGSRPGGLGVAHLSVGEIQVSALVAVNAVGEIDDGSVAAEIESGRFVWPEPDSAMGSAENTSIGVIWTNASLTKIECRLVAESGHDGMGRALIPAHTRFDGDALVAASIGRVAAPLPLVRTLAALAVEQAIRSV